MTQISETLTAGLTSKEFKTGSKGFFSSGKVVQGGNRYQAQVMLTLIGSKQDPTARVAASVTEARKAVEDLADQLAPKTFSSGKSGLYVQGKVVLAGQRFQAAAQAVQIS